MSTTTPTPFPYGISINVYGRGDAALGDGPSHVGIAIFELGSSVCEMHHIRNPNDTDFIYDPRSQPMEDPVLRGRCELETFSTHEKNLITHALSAFGNDISNIPEYGERNCQDWVANAITMLERAGFVGHGEGEFWHCMINQSADAIRDSCIASGQKWIKGPESTFEGEPDARFSDKADSKPVGKLVQNSIFQQRMRSLLGDRHDASESQTAGQPPERPFYVSSPFFSQTGGAK
ncbi:hypothetical protein BDV26DRAFT_274760 [Aspergillus bertholletiae]|uniref:Uncharacterized protein n=1 Tax=Aspergillus bertholletiae TaxID=1226010 RepID=A0A5N7AQH8_9EURO|nr:hypothetical protein BDV26DRAFT_274760 [Aspergillus bertholletiae]